MFRFGRQSHSRVGPSNGGTRGQPVGSIARRAEGKPMRIFISSTFTDLRAEREAAAEALRRSQLVPWGWMNCF